MEVFGSRWQNYTSRLQNNWNKVVGDGDTVIIPGDVSWALTLEEALPDMIFLNSLNGRKIIGKGNHDFWWSTLSKINSTFERNAIDTVDILYNNALRVENYIICGTRGWYVEPSRQNTENQPDYTKIVNREAIRLKLSLDMAEKLKAQSNDNEPLHIVPFFHFPPVWNGYVCREITDILHSYDIKKCYFGHIHGNYAVNRRFEFENVTYELISSDFLDFTPVPVTI